MSVDSRTLRSFSGVMGTPLLRGDAGVEQTMDLLRHLIDDAAKDPAINVQAIQILRAYNVANFGVEDRTRAFYDWISQPANFLYVPDPVGPFGPKETLRPARTLFQVRGGDCDDYTALMASLLCTVGIPVRAVTIAADRRAPTEFSHIYPEAQVGPNAWLPLDAARPGAQYGVPPPFYFRKRVWSLMDSTYTDMRGGQQPTSNLNGYAMLGDTGPNIAAEDISAVGQSVANVIAASKGNPYANFQTPYTPSNVAPQAGYFGGPGGGQGVSLTGSSAIWWILGIAAAGYALTSARQAYRR